MRIENRAAVSPLFIALLILVTILTLISTAYAAPSLKLLSPINGEEWELGSSHEILWRARGFVPGKIKISLYKGKSLKKVLTKNARTAKNGRGAWPWNIGATLAVGSNYRVVLEHSARPRLTATSVGSFSIVGQGMGPEPTIVPVLKKINDSLYYTEHVLYIIPQPGQVDWNSDQSWSSLYLDANMSNYLGILNANFPADYFFVTVTAKNLKPDYVPNVSRVRNVAGGIGQTGQELDGVPNICRYHSSGEVLKSELGVLDHEIGHNWGVGYGSEIAQYGHWLSNSTTDGQMKLVYSEDDYETVKAIRRSSSGQFTWELLDNERRNETEVFSEHDLYMQGLAPRFPDLYVVQNPRLNSDHTVSYDSVQKYDHDWLVATYGARSPDYRSSPKKFKTAMVFVARDFDEINRSYKNMELSTNQIVTSERIDSVEYRFQVPFLESTQFRASFDGRFADLDGNPSPQLSIPGPTYVVSSSGSATIPFAASDPGSPVPPVSCVPYSPNCKISGSDVQVSGLNSGSHFFTIKAQDSQGKKRSRTLLLM